MNLPETNVFDFFNKILISLEDLSPEGAPCPLGSLVTHCKTFTTGGRIGEYEEIIEHCKVIGLLTVKETQVSLTSLGQRFLDANREKFFEITEAQKQLIAERIVFKGTWSQQARDLFIHFSANKVCAYYELSLIEKELPINENISLNLFKYLGILIEDGTLIKVVNNYNQLVYELTADSKAISEQQLEKILMENRKLGAKAENAVVEFEKKRLNKLGKNIQADLVKRISTINTAAGYDIESFDGLSDDVFPNRFIEVKATTGEEIRFYWTHNEREVAKKKKDNYWIYMMRGFRENKPNDCLPITIQNPENVIPNHSSFSIEVNKFLISEIDDVNLKDESIDVLKWYKIEN